MIQTIDNARATGGIDRAAPPSPAPPIAPAAPPQRPAVRGRLAPGDQRRAPTSFDAGQRSPISLGEQLIDAIRPKMRTGTAVKPIHVRLSLLRLADAIEGLEATSSDPFADDPLLKTAHRLLAEEQLRVEMVRHRLQMVLEG